MPPKKPAPEEPDAGRLIGYARVSTEEQDLSIQTDALEKAGCEVIYSEKVSGAAKKRPQLDAAVMAADRGDTLVVVRLDRLGRSLMQVLEWLEAFTAAGVGFRSLNEHLDWSTPMGRMHMQMLAVFAEFERAMIAARTKAGMDKLRADGHILGRERIFTDKMAREAARLRKQGVAMPVIAKQFKVAPNTVYLAWRRLGLAPKKPKKRKT